jgi:hypothetical protein
MGIINTKEELNQVVSRPPVLTAEQLYKLPKGQQFTALAGCCPGGALYDDASSESACRAKGFNYPNTGEFSYRKGNACTLCAFEYGNECDTGVGGGVRPAVYRDHFGAEVKSCCLTQPVNGLINGKACDPALTPGSNECHNHILEYCSVGNNIFYDPVCKQWSNTFKDETWDIKKGKCSSETAIKSDATCRAFIINEGRQNAIDNMDYEVQNYCLGNPTDPMCTCVQSPDDIPCPNVFNKKCMASGYVTQKMYDTKCPPYIDCKQYVNITDKSVLTNSSINQDCRMQLSNDTKPKTAPETPTEPAGISITIWIIIAIVLFIIILTSVTLIIVLRRK